MRVHTDSPGGVILHLVWRSALPGHPAVTLELEDVALAVGADEDPGVSDGPVRPPYRGRALPGRAMEPRPAA